MPLFPRKDRRHRVLYDVHAVGGVAVGLLLYFMFMTGAAALFWSPIEAWEEPAIARAPAAEVDTWWESLLAQEAEPDRVTLRLPHPEDGHRGPVGSIVGADHSYRVLVWEAGEWRPTRARAGRFLFDAHFLHHHAVPVLYDVAGLVSVAMLLALITGLAIHLRDLVPQLHRFRPDKPARVSWADLHKVTAVVGLPFQATFAYTGALLILGNYAIAAVGIPLYGGDLDRATAMAFGEPLPEPEQEPVPAEQVPASALLLAAEGAIPGFAPMNVRVRESGLSTSRPWVVGRVPSHLGTSTVHLSGPTGEVLQVNGPAEQTVPAAAQAWLFSLHFAQIGGWALELLYAVLALATCATLLTGNGLWLARRQRKGEGRFDRILRPLTVGVGAGTPVAMGVILLLSRLLPGALPGRAGWLDLSFVVSLGACCLWAGLAGTGRRTWAAQLGLAAGLFLALPLAQAWATDTGLLGARPEPVVAAVDVGLAAFGVLLALAAAGVARWTRPAPLPEVPRG